LVIKEKIDDNYYYWDKEFIMAEGVKNSCNIE